MVPDPLDYGRSMELSDSIVSNRQKILPLSIKTRYVMSIDQGYEYGFTDTVQVVNGDNIELLSDSRNDSGVDFERFINRVHFGCTLFLYTVDQEIAGWYWGIAPKVDRIWHDRVPIDPETVFLFNAFVPEKHRGRGIYRELIIAAVNYYRRNAPDGSISIVVERRNKVSLYINSSMGFKVVRRNFLIKSFGKNVLSVFTNPIRIYWVLTSAPRNNL